jgi:IMP cyclohydrolase
VEKITAGKASYIAVYEHILPQTVVIYAGCASVAAKFIMDGGKFAEFTFPVTSAADLEKKDGN